MSTTVPPASLYDASPNDVLTALRAATAAMHDSNARLVAALEDIGRPAQMETVVINPGNNGQYTFESRERFEAPVMSIGLLNPNGINIYFSTVGSAAAGMRSPSVPPNCLLVLPISAQMIEVAANPTDLAANTAIVFLLRYSTVQPAFLGKGA